MKKQQMRFSDSELSLIKNTFAENEELLQALRKVFLQMPLDVIDKDILKGTLKDKKELMTLLYKVFKPELDPKAPRHQLVDLWMTIDTSGKQDSELEAIFRSRDLLIKLLAQQLEVLEAIVNDEEIEVELVLNELVNYKKMKDLREFHGNLIARNTFIGHVEFQLTQLDVLGGQKDETVEQTKERLKKDSSK